MGKTKETKTEIRADEKEKETKKLKRQQLKKTNTTDKKERETKTQKHQQLKNKNKTDCGDGKEKETRKRKHQQAASTNNEVKPTKKKKNTQTLEPQEVPEPPKAKKTTQKTKKKSAAIKSESKAKNSEENGKEEIKKKFEQTKASSKLSGIEKYVGAHVSISGGLENAVYEAVEIGARAFGMFLKSQRQWICKPLEDSAAQKFRNACVEYGFPPHMIVPHGSYLLNCGSPNVETQRKSREMLTDELQRCEKLGLALFNFHPGSTCGEISIEESIGKIAECINQSHSKTKYVITVIENMSCQGNTIGGDFKELKAIIDHVEDKSRIAVCLDTCHAFAAGYNLASQEGFDKMMTDFENIVGLKYLKAVHINDSKGNVGCHLDRHENIGKGQIGLEGFRRIMNDPRFDNIPFILETPETDYSREIKKLYSLCQK